MVSFWSHFTCWSLFGLTFIYRILINNFFKKTVDIPHEEETAGVLKYVYRYWHYYSGESSREIYKIADAKMMKKCWLGFHTLDVEMAIDNLKEIYRLS